MADIEMPQLGETVTEGTITKWFKAVGDQVDLDEVLFEVSTDKVDSEVPSPVAGTLAEILVEEGDTVDVGTRLAVISDGGAPAADAPAEATHEDAAPQQDAPAEEPPASEAAASEPPASEPEPEAPASEPEPAPAPEPAPEAPSASSDEPGLLLSPVVRRLVEEHDLDAAEITGTGPGGRITRSDVQQVIEQRGGPAPAPAAPAPASAPAPAAAAPTPTATPQAASAPAAAPAHDEVEPLNNIRLRTAEHMVRSKAVSAHVFTIVEVDFERVDQARRAHKEQFRADEGINLTYLPFVARALIDAVAEFPHLNASVGDGELIVHQDVNLGIAVDLGGAGLIVPVIHRSQDMRLRAIARNIAELADRARGKKLSADDITGGTVTISNNGGAGTFATTAIINQPQVMVLSTEGVSRKPVVVTDSWGAEAIAIHSVGNLTLGWDHRAFDGAYAGAFLARIRELLETRDWEAEL